MTRRSATLAVAGALLVALVAVAALFPVPYVVFSPGPIEDVLGEVEGTPVVSVEGAETFPTDGVLDLTTVGVTSADRELDLLSAFRAWADPDRAVLPRRLVYPEGTTSEQSRDINAALLDRSEESAKVAALRKTGAEVPERPVVEAVVVDSPAEGVLEPGDLVLAVDGVDVAEPAEVSAAVQDRAPGDPVELTLLRDGEERTETVVTAPAPEDPQLPVVGIQVGIGYDLPVQVDIAIDERIGGPSAGLVFALAIYDKLTPGALLGGRHVAGTGEITSDGEVGSIGGIQQKIAAAGEEGADVFLAPADNCEDVVGANARDMRVVPVATFDEAVSVVESVAAGDLDSLPSCPVA